MFAIQFVPENNDGNILYYRSDCVWIADLDWAEKFSHLDHVKKVIKKVKRPSMTARGNKYMKPKIVEIGKAWGVVRVVE